MEPIAPQYAKVDNTSFTETVQPPTPDPVTTTYTLDQLKGYLATVQKDKDDANARCDQQMANIQAKIDAAVSLGVLTVAELSAQIVDNPEP